MRAWRDGLQSHISCFKIWLYMPISISVYVSFISLSLYSSFARLLNLSYITPTLFLYYESVYNWSHSIYFPILLFHPSIKLLIFVWYHWLTDLHAICYNWFPMVYYDFGNVYMTAMEFIFLCNITYSETCCGRVELKFLFIWSFVSVY